MTSVDAHSFMINSFIINSFISGEAQALAFERGEIQATRENMNEGPGACHRGNVWWPRALDARNMRETPFLFTSCFINVATMD